MNGEYSSIEKEVINAIKWQPILDKENIQVSVIDGIATLSGIVDSYIKKRDLEKTASNVAGIDAIIGNIEVKFPDGVQRSNEDIAQEAVSFIKSNEFVPHDAISIKVEDGWLTLEGEVEYKHQREEADQSIHYITGLKGINNNIRLIPKIQQVETTFVPYSKPKNSK
jgi:osmotically-inducible protein OsmY